MDENTMTGILSPSAKQQFFTNGSEVAAGYRLFIYSAGTTTPAPTFADRAASIPNQFPIVLDARGEATIYLTPGLVYDYVLRTGDDALVWTRTGVAVDQGGADSVAFVQAGSGAVSRSTQDKLRERVSVKDFGAVGDNATDDTSAILAAVSACHALGGGELFFPSGIYKINDQILLSAPLWLVGEGVRKTIIRQTSATANGVNFTYPTMTAGGGLRGITIESGDGWHASGSMAPGSTGTALIMEKVLGSFQAKDFALHNFSNGLRHNLCWGTWVQNADILFFNGRGVTIDGSPGGGGNGDNRWQRITCHNNGYTGDASSSIGFLVLNTGHEQFMMCDAVKTATGWMFRPDSAAKQVSYVFADQCLADSAYGNGWDFDGSVGGVVSVYCSNCWSAGSVSNGVVTRNNVYDILWTGGRVRENGSVGWLMNGGQDVSIIGTGFSTNSRLSPNTYPGILVAPGVSKWAVVGCRIGNYASATSFQGNGIEIQAGASDNFRIVGNDFANAGSGKVGVVNGSTLSSGFANYVIDGNIPQGEASNNEKRGTISMLCTNGAVAAATTTYIGPNGNSATELDSLMLMGRAGRVARIQVNADNPPGAGQSFTYTLRHTGADSPMVAQLTDSGSATFTVANAQNLNANALFSIKLVTSAGAASARHRVTVSIDPA